MLHAMHPRHDGTTVLIGSSMFGSLHVQELTAGDSQGETALVLKARLVVAHLPPHVKLSVTQPANGAAPALRANGAYIPVGSTAALRWDIVCTAH